MTDTQVITECQCEKCKRLCAKNPGWFAPDEAKRAIEMGLADRLMLDWLDVDSRYNIAEKIWILSPAADVEVFGGKKAPEWDEMHGDTGGLFFLRGEVWKGTCAFFHSGLCRIHHTSFKPIECRTAFACDVESSNHIEVGKLWDSDDGRAIVALWKTKVAFVEDGND